MSFKKRQDPGYNNGRVRALSVICDNVSNTFRCGDLADAEPTHTHMCITAMYRKGLVCDPLYFD